MSDTEHDTEVTDAGYGRSAHDRLCDEHTSIGRDLARLTAVADRLKTAPVRSYDPEIGEAHQLVAKRIIPHLEAELALRNHLASRDYRQIEVDPVTRDIEKLHARLDELTSHMDAGPNGSAQSIREVLYDIRALARSHFTEE
jgi:hypothetical protein